MVRVLIRPQGSYHLESPTRRLTTLATSEVGSVNGSVNEIKLK